MASFHWSQHALSPLVVPHHYHVILHCALLVACHSLCYLPLLDCHSQWLACHSLCDLSLLACHSQWLACHSLCDLPFLDCHSQWLACHSLCALPLLDCHSQWLACHSLCDLPLLACHFSIISLLLVRHSWSPQWDMNVHTRTFMRCGNQSGSIFEWWTNWPNLNKPIH